MPKKKRVVVDREKFLTGWDEFEDYTGRSRDFLLKEIRAGRLKAKNLGRRWMTTKADCDKWMEQHLYGDSTP